MRPITGRAYEIPSYAQHLKEFCENSHGPVLQSVGVKHRFRYRFVSPLMQPFVIMLGVLDKLVDRQAIAEPGAGEALSGRTRARGGPVQSLEPAQDTPETPTPPPRSKRASLRCAPW